MKNINLKLISVMFAGILATSCSTMKQTETDAKKSLDKGEKSLEDSKIHTKNNYITFDNDILVATKSHKFIKKAIPLPKVFSEKFIYQTNQSVDLSKVMAEISNMSSLSVILSGDAMHYLDLTDEVDKQKKSDGDKFGVNLHYKGTLKGLLDRVGDILGLWWMYNEKSGKVVFYRTETKTFSIDALPGVTTTNSSIKSNSSDAKGQQDFNTKYDFGEHDSWKSANTTIISILGADGSINSNPALGLITVTATPSAMAKVERYIAKINKTAKQRIAVRVEIYDVTSSANNNYGLDWNIVYSATRGSIDWSEAGIVTPSSDPFAGAKIGTAKLAAKINSGPFKGTGLIADALQKVGKTTLVTATTLYAVSGKPSPVQVARNTSYIKSVSTTLNQNQSQTAAEPGSIDTGYSLVVTPKIVGTDDILVNVAVNISTLIAMRSASFGSGGNDSFELQLPDVQSKTFMQTVPLQSGQTAVLAGFQNNANNTATNSVGPEELWLLGGQKATSTERTTTVIIVTPYIME